MQYLYYFVTLYAKLFCGVMPGCEIDMSISSGEAVDHKVQRIRLLGRYSLESVLGPRVGETNAE